MELQQRRYGIAVTTSRPPDEVEHLVREALEAEGFGILTEIDVAETLERKIGVRRAPYKILGACNPHLANRALDVDEEIGVLLPCNVVVRQVDDGTEVQAMAPDAMTTLSGREALGPIAQEARQRLERALQAVGDA